MNGRSQEFTYSVQNSSFEAASRTTFDSIWMAKQCWMESLEISENLKGVMSFEKW